MRNDRTPKHAVQALIAEQDAAEYLGVTRRQLQRWRVEGGGPLYYKLGHRTVRYAVDQLDRWLAEQPLLASTSDGGGGR